MDAWKQEPDLFLHAAATMSMAPAACTVVEDSRLGVQAAVAAGMRVIAYAPRGNRFPGAITIQQLDQLP